MPDYKFTLRKQTELVITAADPDSAWVEIMKVNPELLGLQWQIDLEDPTRPPPALPIDQGPVEVDDFGGDSWDLSYLDSTPKG